jgi:hypothetical protein
VVSTGNTCQYRHVALEVDYNIAFSDCEAKCDADQKCKFIQRGGATNDNCWYYSVCTFQRVPDHPATNYYQGTFFFFFVFFFLKLFLGYGSPIASPRCKVSLVANQTHAVFLCVASSILCSRPRLMCCR